MKAFNVRPRYKTSGDLGVEVEVEGVDLPRPDKYWITEHDGSLRGEAREYVLKKPMSAEGVAAALTYLDKCYIDEGTEVFESVRAGVHVHVNVQDLTVVQLYTFMTAYIILEDLLTKFCGEYREGNLFCLRVRDADYLLYMLERVAVNKEYNAFNTDMLRYAAMNVKSLSTYGSLEFRAMRGTRDLLVINSWANILMGIRDKAKEFESPKALVEWIKVNSMDLFLELFLGDYLTEVVKSCDGKPDLLGGFSNAYHLATNPDWESYKTKSIGGLDFPVGVEYPDEPEEDF